MALILCARYVHCPRHARRCDECGRLLGPHIYLYGRADAVDLPSALRLCAEHVADPDPKVQAALADAKRRAPDAEAEAARLATWNGVPSRDQS